MELEDIQLFVQGLIQAQPQLAAAAVAVILDDGTYPKIPAFEKALADEGLVIVIWRMGCFGLKDVTNTGISNELVHIAVVIVENVEVNRKVGGTGIKAETALRYVRQVVAGQPIPTPGQPSFTPILPWHDPWDDLGVINGRRVFVLNFVKEHRVMPVPAR